MDKLQAVAMANTGWWKRVPLETAAMFQLHEDTLCMDFGDFHEGVEKLLGRPVWSHEFAKPELLRAELRGVRAVPTMDEMLAMIPEEKLIVMETPCDS